MTYEERISAMMSELMAGGSATSSLTPLMCALGCRHVVQTKGGKGLYLKPGQPEAVHEGLVTATLIQVMHLQIPILSITPSDNITSILDGLLRKNRWRHCLRSTDTAVEFAAVLASFWVARPQSPASRRLLQDVSTPVCTILNRWLQPTTPFAGDPLSGPPLTYSVACSIFGEAWCSVALAGAVDSQWDIPQIIREQRPPLRPGLLPKRLESRPQVLPALEMS